MVTWKDLSPRLGIVYDLFGNGRTAFKATANRHVSGQGPGIARGVNPAFTNGESRRNWLDGRGVFAPARLCYSPDGVLDFGYLLGGPNTYGCVPGDGIVQGDPLNPLPNGELIGATDNVNFAQPLVTNFYDPDYAFGWGNRLSNWEFSAGLQHELVDGLSINVSYFRRIYVNFSTQDNPLLSAADYDPFCVTAPDDPRLPNAGQELCNFEVTPEKFGITGGTTTSSDNFGKQTQHWNGVDVTVTARMQNGLLLQGGLSTGRQSEDDCEVAANVDNPNILYCAWQTPFLTQVKFLGSYTLPYDIQIAGTFQNLPGNEISANTSFTREQVEASLGRPSNSSTTTFQTIEPGTEYTERLNQFDLRVTKIFNVGPSRLRAMFDIYNVFNNSTPLQRNNQYGQVGTTWQSPQLVIPGRLIKFALQVDF